MSADAKLVKTIAATWADPARGLTIARTYQTLKSRPGVTLAKVREVVNTLRPYATTRRPRRAEGFRIVDNRDDSWQLDLTFFPSPIRKYVGLLTAVEITTRIAWAAPIRSKTAREMVRVLTAFIEDAAPRYIATDNGTEFLNAPVQALLKAHGIRHTAADEIDNKRRMAIVESFNRTIRARMTALSRARDRRDILDELPDILVGYNTATHSSLGVSPLDMHKYYPLRTHYRQEASDHNARLRGRIAADHVLQPGDAVRYRTTRGKFEKEGQTYTDAVYTVVEPDPRRANGLRVKLSNGRYYLPRDLILATAPTGRWASLTPDGAAANPQQSRPRVAFTEEAARRRKTQARRRRAEGIDFDRIPTRKSRRTRRAHPRNK